MISIKNKKEIDILREGGKILASILYKVSDLIRPDIATIELDKVTEELIKRAGARPSFKNYKSFGDRIPFPASICVSINSEVVHGIPSKEKILKEGDIISLDMGMEYKGFYTDIAITVPVGKVEKESQKIIDVAKKSLNKGIGAIKAGARIGDISFAVQSYVESQDFNVVRKLVGHGIGYNVHEEPEIPNYGKPKTGYRLKKGMVLALEPMVTKGNPEVILDKDNWTWKTKDNSISAHFEHTVVVTKTGAEVLTNT